VVRQLRRVPWRAVLAQVGGRSAQHQAGGGELAADEGGVGQAGDAHREIKTFFHQIDHAVGQGHVQRDLGVHRHELHPQRRQVQQAEGEGRVDAQQATGLAAARRDLGLGLVHGGQHLLATRVKHLALGRERELARGPVQQAHAQARFELGHVA